MANEIYHDYDSASTLYAFVYRQSDGYIYDVGDTAFEAIGTWNDARADQCDIAMTASGDFHMGAFPAVAAGTYYVVIRDQAGANAAIADTPVTSYRLGWDGAAVVTDYTLYVDIASVETYQKTTHNKYDET